MLWPVFPCVLREVFAHFSVSSFSYLAKRNAEPQSTPRDAKDARGYTFSETALGYKFLVGWRGHGLWQTVGDLGKISELFCERWC